LNKGIQLFDSDPEIFGGALIFFGTRLPIGILFENLAGGLSLDEILDSYPSLKREQAIEALRQAEKILKGQKENFAPIKSD
jgi:uncharacterized protein (DUF433 family)